MWDPALDSPLLAFTDPHPRDRARFTVQPVPPRPPADNASGSVDGLLAGAAEVDITPPPGMPKAGYSGTGQDGTGFRTRIRARVVHLRSATSSLAIVQCDLLGGSSVVQHLVARAIADRTDVPLAGLLIGATHTHAGPGQFLGTDFYNRFASNRSGFDAAFTQFLVERISGAVIRAVETRRPARLAFGATEVWGLTRNRSLDPYVRNQSVHDKRTEAQRKWVSINPFLHLLRVDVRADDGGYEPLAATVVFSVHGTGISRHATEYNADVWAYLTGELAQRITQTHGIRPVVGAIEGTHADVAPALRPGSAGYLEARRIGTGIGAAAAALYERLEGELSDDVQLGVGLREIDLARSHSIEGIELPRRPAVGAVLVAGAHENLTPIVHRAPGFRAGSPKRHPDRIHGPKRVLGTRWLQPLYVPLRHFPRVLPVQVLRIGGVALVGLPFELTVETGRRIEQRVTDALARTGVDRVVVSSVANEYAGYIATAEEYSLQHYEGGHTLYGPNSQPFLAAHAARLAGEVARSGFVVDVLPERRFDLRLRRFLARQGAPSADRRVFADPVFTDPTKSDDGYWELGWHDVGPGDLRWHEPLVRVEAHDRDGAWGPAQHNGRVVDDSAWDISVVHLGADERGHRYRARWHDPAFRSGRQHRFVLVPNSGRPELTSRPFD